MLKLTAQALVQKNIDLVSLPDVALKLNALINEPHSTAQDIADVIATDAALTAQLLQIVNSAFYNFPQQVDTITMAITVIGTAQLRDLAMATLIIQKFNRIPENLVTPEAFWSHNIACATAARTIVTELGMQHPERVFVAGLLHDIGRLLMYVAEPALSADILQQLKLDNGLDINQLEKASFGYDHAELGAVLLKEWGLPDSLVQPVKYHHMPDQADMFTMEANVLHLANVVANQIKPLFAATSNLSLDEKVWHVLNSSPEYLADITCTSKVVYNDTVRIFYPDEQAA